jgi:hypothetical protein
VPYGYAYDKNTQTLKPDPVDAPVVRRIFDHAAKLGSLTDLANALNAEGLRTKIRLVRRRDGVEETIGNRFGDRTVSAFWSRIRFTARRCAMPATNIPPSTSRSYRVRCGSRRTLPRSTRNHGRPIWFWSGTGTATY